MGNSGSELARYINIWFTQTRGGDDRVWFHLDDLEKKTASWGLPKSQEYFLRVQIARHDERTIVENPSPFPNQSDLERAYPEIKGKPIPIKVTLESDFETR